MCNAEVVSPFDLSRLRPYPKRGLLCYGDDATDASGCASSTARVRLTPGRLPHTTPHPGKRAGPRTPTRAWRVCGKNGPAPRVRRPLLDHLLRRVLREVLDVGHVRRGDLREPPHPERLLRVAEDAPGGVAMEPRRPLQPDAADPADRLLRPRRRPLPAGPPVPPSRPSPRAPLRQLRLQRRDVEPRVGELTPQLPRTLVEPPRHRAEPGGCAPGLRLDLPADRSLQPPVSDVSSATA